MNVRAFPSAHRLPVKAQLAIWIPTATTYPATHIKSPPRNQIAIGEFAIRFRHKTSNRSAQLFRNALVGVEAEDPFVCCLLGSKLLLRRKSRPRIFQNTRTTLRRKLAGPIRRARV